ncbi:MAG: formylglycine-generating enzyme family protein [Gemmataceae bacterium]
MNDELRLLAAIDAAPGDDLAWLALADALEEAGQPDRAEVTRVARSLRALPRGRPRTAAEKRLAGLLAAGVRPSVPERLNSLGMRLALVPAGAFDMGAPPREKHRSAPEFYHRVEITRPFHLGVFPVTQAQYLAVAGTNPAYFRDGGGGAAAVAGVDTGDFPVEDVTWEQAVAFCAALSALPAEKRAKRAYRLPTEAEWEYACRAGTTTPFHSGRTLAAAQANFDGSQPYGRVPRGPYLARTVPVGQYPPNAWGLYDMHGNVWEWCADWYDANGTRSGPAADPPGPAGGTLKVLRGGSCYSNGEYCRAACRFHCVPDRIAYRCRGLRVVLVQGRAATRR